MKIKFLLLCCIISVHVFAQNDTTVIKDTAMIKDTTVVDISNELNNKQGAPGDVRPAAKVFYGQRLINANTVEVLRKGVMEFRVIHNFGNVADSAGVRNFFGLDGAFDVKIGFQIGLSDKTNILLARAKGASSVSQLWEFGIKHQFLRQVVDDQKHPLSLTVFANVVASAAKATHNIDRETNFNSFGDRLSEIVQLMIARKFGSVSLQLSPTYLHKHYVIPGDQSDLFALGGGLRIPISKRFIFIADYFHTFRSQASKDLYYNLQRVHFYDALGVGFEIVTQGHVFHMNFTNATEIDENRFISRTTTTWGKGEFRWGFTISRNFILFRDKKNR